MEVISDTTRSKTISRAHCNSYQRSPPDSEGSLYVINRSMNEELPIQARCLYATHSAAIAALSIRFVCSNLALNTLVWNNLDLRIS